MASRVSAGTRDAQRGGLRRRSAIGGARSRMPAVVGILVGLPLGLGLWLVLFLGVRALIAAI